MTFREFVAAVYGALSLVCAYTVAFEAEGAAADWTTPEMGGIFPGPGARRRW